MDRHRHYISISGVTDMTHAAILDIIDDCLAGVISERLAQIALSAINVFGAFHGEEYFGFDYGRGEHIHVKRY